MLPKITFKTSELKVISKGNGEELGSVIFCESEPKILLRTLGAHLCIFLP